MSELSPREAPQRERSITATDFRSGKPESDDNVWTGRLVLFLRVMAVLSMGKGLYHWAQVTGFVGGENGAFENQTTA